jgi:hypothetical protein
MRGIWIANVLHSLADLWLYGTNQPAPWAFKMNRAERYEGTVAQVYSIEFQSDRYVEILSLSHTFNRLESGL